jgi:hypothetical protein
MPTCPVAAHSVKVTAGIGLSEAGAAFDGQLAAIDAAIYRAKTTGTGIAVHDAREDDRLDHGICTRPVSLRRTGSVPDDL